MVWSKYHKDTVLEHCITLLKFLHSFCSRHFKGVELASNLHSPCSVVGCTLFKSFTDYGGSANAAKCACVKDGEAEYLYSDLGL